MTSKEIFSRIENNVKNVMDLVSMCFDDSLILLRHFKWNHEKIENEYFNDCEKYQEDCGIVLKKLAEREIPKSSNEAFCNICYQKGNIIDNQLSCKHQLCKNCWIGYFNFKVI